ncbi:hypothetical protein ACWEG1_05405 [Streptomyces bauhiniae]
MVLVEALVALSAAGGSAVVQAAGTDAWSAMRTGFARLLGQGETTREQRELERLDRTQSVLEAATADEIEQVRVAQAAAWSSRLEMLLEELPDAQRQQVANELRALVDQTVTDADRPAHNDFRGSTFEKSAVQGSGTQHNTFN